MNKLKQAIKLREEGNLKESQKILLLLHNENPEDAMINYQCAWIHDVMGLEKEAIPFYEKAISLGLPDGDLKEAYLGLGSTFRTIGKYENSYKILSKGFELFKDDVFNIFLSMTLYNLGNHKKAMEYLLKYISENPGKGSVKTFQKAINFYSDKLDEIF